MTINTNNPRKEYTATGGQTTFSYDFRIFDEADIEVYQTDSGATASDSDIITAYSVTGVGVVGGGTIVLDSGATANDLITIVYAPDLQRTTNYVSNGDYTAAAVNADNEERTNFIKYVHSLLRRIPQFSKAQQGVNDLSMDAPKADEILLWNSSGDGITSAPISVDDLQAVISSAEAVLADSNAGAVSYDGTSSGLAATDVQGAVDEVEARLQTAETKVGNIVTLSGVAANATHLGTFTGSTIADSRTVKQALQDIETAIERAGDWVPTLTAVSNVTAVTLNGNAALYSRIKNIVTCTVSVNLDTAGVGGYAFAISLPVASNFSDYYDVIGIGISGASTTALFNGTCSPDLINDRVTVSGYSGANYTQTVSLTFQYIVR